DATARALGEPAGDLALASSRGRPAAGGVDDLVPLLGGQLAEPRTTGDADAMLLDEPLDARAPESDALPPVEHKPAAYQAELAPARDRLGRDVKLLGEFLHGEDLLHYALSVDVDRVGQVLHEQTQIAQQFLPRRLLSRTPFGTEAGDAVANVLVGIGLIRIELADQMLG